MNRTIIVALTLPVTIRAAAENDSGDVVITDVLSVRVPSVSDIERFKTDDNLRAIDEAFDEAK